jgi:hypothetical protein
MGDGFGSFFNLVSLCGCERPFGMVQARVAKKLLNVTFQEFLRCPFFALGPRFHKNRDILEVVYYNVKLLC